MDGVSTNSKQSNANKVIRSHPDWYRLLFDYANDAIFVYQRNPNGAPGYLLDVNEAACNLLGYTKSQLLKMTMYHLTAPERHANYPSFKEKLDSEGHVITETVKLAKGGRRIPAEQSSHLFDLDGKPTVVSIVRDISERKRIHHQLIESQQRYFTVVNSAYDAISLHEMNMQGKPGRYVEVNDAFCHRVGYSRKELLKLTPWDLVEQRGQARIEHLREEILLKKGILFDVTEVAKDGKKTPVEISAKLLEINDKKYVLSVSRDVSERKRIENELIESEEQYRMLFNSINDAVMVHHMDASGKYTNYIEVNDVACQMLGYGREQLLKMKPIDLVAPEQVDSLDGRRSRIFTSETNTVFRTVLVASDGRKIPVEVSSHGFNYKSRRLVIAVIRDITERKHTENQLLEVQDKLARNEKLAALGQLASGIAHDMGTPLTVITNVAAFLREILDDADEIVRVQLSRLERQTEIANRIAGDLLDFAKMRKPELKEITMDMVVSEALAQIDIPENIIVALKFPESTCAVLLDISQMVRVLDNIISNAVLAMPDGGELTIGASDVDEHVLLQIKDTGVGISADNLSKIFEPLFTTRMNEGSTGIGLATCKSIVESHNGVIDVESEEGVGATFTIKLPCAV